jgi:hypothetical protein
VDRRYEAPQRTFNPMLVEVCLRPRSLLEGAAAPASLGVLGARENPVLPGSDEPRIDVEDCGALGADNGATSASRLVAEDLGESLAPSTVVTVADVVAQVVTLRSASSGSGSCRITYSTYGLLAELHRIP